MVETLEFVACMDGFLDARDAAARDGIDNYFGNVGGAAFDAELPLLNTSDRTRVCA